MTQNEPNFFRFSITKQHRNNETGRPLLNNSTSICLSMLFAMTSKVLNKQNNFKINREGGIFKKIPKIERSPALSEDLAGLPVKGGQKVGVIDYPET